MKIYDLAWISLLGHGNLLIAAHSPQEAEAVFDAHAPSMNFYGGNTSTPGLKPYKVDKVQEATAPAGDVLVMNGGAVEKMQVADLLGD